MADSIPPFTIGAIKEVPPRSDGSLRRNRWAIMVEVDGVTHRVFIRRSHGQVHIPLPLRSYKHAARMKRAIADLMQPYVQAAKPAQEQMDTSQAAPRVGL